MNLKNFDDEPYYKDNARTKKSKKSGRQPKNRMKAPRTKPKERDYHLIAKQMPKDSEFHIIRKEGQLKLAKEDKF